jgi:hypothetical protein
LVSASDALAHLTNLILYGFSFWVESNCAKPARRSAISALLKWEVSDAVATVICARLGGDFLATTETRTDQ